MSKIGEIMPICRPFVIGTSGHIDHGKTTLVKAITGVDTDRFEEEKKRGITIDLGFAHCENGKGGKIAFVDVPGHEKFIHNMLAGMAGIDAVLLVVAADKGVMPQTREHLNICNLLKIKSGIVALTRIDLVKDEELVALCRDEVLELIEGTFLEDKPVILVSGINGEGLEELKEELFKLTDRISIHGIEKSFRLNVDRSFTLKGFGTVVTGTVLSGSVSQDEEIKQFPQRRSIRIRGMQTHGTKVKTVYAGQRAALNLAGITREEIQRGDQLAKHGSLLTSYMLNATLFLLEDLSLPLKNRTRIRLYIGSKEVFGRIMLLQGSMSPGKKSIVQFRLESLVSTRYGDRFIIRSFSPILTLGGGMVLDPSPSKSKRMMKELPDRISRLYDEEENVRGEEIIYLQSVRGVVESEFLVRSGFSKNQSRKVFQNLLDNQKVICIENVSKRYIHVENLDRVGKFFIRMLGKHHERFSERTGMTCAELAGKINVLFKEKEIEIILKYFVKRGIFIRSGQFYHLLGHRKQISKLQENNLENCIRLITSGGFQPMRRTRLLEEIGLREKDGINMLKSAVHSKLLLSVSEDLYYTPKQMEEILLILQKYFQSNKNITVIQFKELLNISRKHAIDLLEYFDKLHLTVRRDNYRVPGKIIYKKD